MAGCAHITLGDMRLFQVATERNDATERNEERAESGGVRFLFDFLCSWLTVPVQSLDHEFDACVDFVLRLRKSTYGSFSCWSQACGRSTLCQQV